MCGVIEGIGPEFEPKPEKSKKPKTFDILKFKKLSKSIPENILQKNSHLESVTVKKIYFLTKQGNQFTVLVHKNIFPSTNIKSVS